MKHNHSHQNTTFLMRVCVDKANSHHVLDVFSASLWLSWGVLSVCDT